MKKLISAIWAIGMIMPLFGQKGLIENRKRGPFIYSIFYNQTPDGNKIPMIGFVNTGIGNQTGFQAGFFNTTTGSFKGFQAGFVNTTLKDMTGFQSAFINTVGRQMKGFQAGFVNSVIKESNGMQLGFLNYDGKISHASQIGFLNISGKRKKGIQLGFINYADSVEKGVPIGFLSFVRRGGYMATELSVSEMAPFQFSFKTGVHKFYTFLTAGYNPWANKKFSVGAGLGNFTYLGKKGIFINPEVQTVGQITKNSTMITSAGLFLGYETNFRMQFILGPSVSHQYKFSSNTGEFTDPLFSFYTANFGETQKLHLGARVGIRYSFSKSRR